MVRHTAEWERTERRNVSDVTPYGTVAEWEHKDTGDTVTVEVSDDEDGRVYYVRRSDQTDNPAGASTLSDALDTARYMVAHEANEDGFDEGGR